MANFEAWLAKQPPAYQEAYDKGARLAPADLAKRLAERLAQKKGAPSADHDRLLERMKEVALQRPTRE